jgi:hypothetical protein
VANFEIGDAVDEDLLQATTVGLDLGAAEPELENASERDACLGLSREPTEDGIDLAVIARGLHAIGSTGKSRRAAPQDGDGIEKRDGEKDRQRSDSKSE